jgi:hypothetical protein
MLFCEADFKWFMMKLNLKLSVAMSMKTIGVVFLLFFLASEGQAPEGHRISESVSNGWLHIRRRVVLGSNLHWDNRFLTEVFVIFLNHSRQSG